MVRLAGKRCAGAILLAFVSSFSAPHTGNAQAPSAPRTVGLALSGGSAKGIAHVGVLRTLERMGVRIDVVAGTSMGAVVGGMYALGLSVDSIESVIASADWPSLINDAVPRGRRSLDQRRLDERAILAVPLEGRRVTLPSGAIIGSNVMRLLENVFWRAATVRRFRDLPLPFVVVATDLETGAAVPLREGVLSEALRASAGVPGAVEPITLEGKLLVDGALSRNLPATDARDLGADFVICSDVSEPIDSADELESLVDVLSQLASLSMLSATLAQRATCDVLILPDVDELSGFDFDRVEEWVARGEAATVVHEAALEGVAARPPRSDTARAVPALLGDSVRITGIDVAGSSDFRMIDLIRRELELAEGDFVDRERLEARLADLESTGLFALARYRLDQQGDGVALTVTVDERSRDRLGVGLRYDDERRAALLFTATVHHVLTYGSVSRLDLRVGEESHVAFSLRRRRGLTGRLGVGFDARWSQGSLLLPPAEGGRTDIDVWRGSVSLGLSPARAAYLGLELAGEWTSASRGSSDPASVSLVSGSVVLDHETLDRIDFPRLGVDVTGRLEWGMSDVAEAGWFSSTIFDAAFYVPIHPRLVVDVGVFAGYTRGVDLPSHRRLFLGGAHRSAVFRATQPTFQGLESQAQPGRAVQVGRLGIRAEVSTDWFVRGGVDVGAARDTWRAPLSVPMTGWAISAGFRSRIGPVVGELSKVWGNHDPRASVSVGRSF